MKVIGMIILACGFAFLLFVAYTFMKNSNKIVSPIPEEKGVKVIFVSPTP
jgi:glycopeptide antibiotics resistance protein